MWYCSQKVNVVQHWEGRDVCRVYGMYVPKCLPLFLLCLLQETGGAQAGSSGRSGRSYSTRPIQSSAIHFTMAALWPALADPETLLAAFLD
jgi:hypothetical protein